MQYDLNFTLLESLRICVQIVLQVRATVKMDFLVLLYSTR